MPKRSAGLLLHRETDQGLEVLLVHPGGPFWAKKDAGAWSIPKGLIEESEAPLAAARREFEEETGVAPPSGDALPLEPLRQPGGKIVHAWAVRGDLDPAAVRSNTFNLGASVFPEIDRAGWFPLAAARRKILPGQAGFLDQLERLLARP